MWVLASCSACPEMLGCAIVKIMTQLHFGAPMGSAHSTFSHYHQILMSSIRHQKLIMSVGAIYGQYYLVLGWGAQYLPKAGG